VGISSSAKCRRVFFKLYLYRTLELFLENGVEEGFLRSALLHFKLLRLFFKK
jgi:hypothetical protein